MSEQDGWLALTEANPEHSQWFIDRFRSMAAAGADLAGEARLIDAMLARGSRVLDAGCGTGRVGAFLAAAGHDVVGLAMEAVLGLVAAVVGAMVLTADRHARIGEARRRHKLLGSALGAGAVGGMVVATVQTLIAAGVLESDTGPILRWAVLPVLPAATAVILLGAVIVWRPQPPPSGGWRGCGSPAGRCCCRLWVGC
jgi:SAM-dependent methyltransferase